MPRAVTRRRFLEASAGAAVLAGLEPAAVEPEPVATRPDPEPIEPADEGSDPMNGPMAEEGDHRGGLTPAAEADEPEPADPAVDPERARAILDEALDALGAAHHRPFSRG